MQMAEEEASALQSENWGTGENSAFSVAVLPEITRFSAETMIEISWDLVMLQPGSVWVLVL